MGGGQVFLRLFFFGKALMGGMRCPVRRAEPTSPATRQRPRGPSSAQRPGAAVPSGCVMAGSRRPGMAGERRAPSRLSPAANRGPRQHTAREAETARPLGGSVPSPPKPLQTTLHCPKALCARTTWQGEGREWSVQIPLPPSQGKPVRNHASVWEIRRGWRKKSSELPQCPGI